MAPLQGEINKFINMSVNRLTRQRVKTRSLTSSVFLLLDLSLELQKKKKKINCSDNLRNNIKCIVRQKQQQQNPTTLKYIKLHLQFHGIGSLFTDSH